MRRRLAPLLLLALAAVHPALAIEGEPPSERGISDVPAGPGVLHGAVVHRDPSRSTEGLSVGLYSLSPDGRPSLRQRRTDAEGRFRFEQIANSPQVLYLVGVRVGDIPYGVRVRFAEGSTDAQARIEIDDPIASRKPLELAESRVTFGWHGDKLGVSEEHRLVNRGDRVVYLPREPGPGAEPVLEVRLPNAASKITPGFGHVKEHFERRGERLLFWGPVHPGENRVTFSYEVPVASTDSPPDGDPSVAYRPRIRPAPETFTALVPETDPEPEVSGLAGAGRLSDAERTFRSFHAEGPAAGGNIAIGLRAPPQETDPGLLEISGANVWLELDDTALDVKIDYNLEVTGNARLAGSPEAPLLAIELPEKAELLGMAPGPDRVGAILDGGTRVDIAGPLPSGPSTLQLHYRLPADAAGAAIELDFPRDVPLLNVLVADTGVRIENDRLHRRRPTRQGTRLFLHREGFQVKAGERLALRLRRIDHANLPRLASRIAVLTAAALAIAFMITPLRRRESFGSEGGDAKGDASARRNERDALYASMRDLEHDFETGKLDAEDHAELKRELELRAAQLMREDGEERPEPAPPVCRSCAAPLHEGWRFCARCGASL